MPDPGYSLNLTLRTPLFTGPFLSSPLLPNGEHEYITDSQGCTWLYNTFDYMAIELFNKADYGLGITRYSAGLVAPAPLDSIQLVINDKNQPQMFATRDEAEQLIDYCFATDPNGNVFIVGSVDVAYAEDPVAAFLDSKLPKGWTKQVKTLEQDLTIEPGAGAGHRNVYNQFRNNLTNNFFQIEFVANGIGIARGVPGLPLSGGVNSDLIRPGRGVDQLWGGSGRGVFRVSHGAKMIHDFSVSEGDRLRFAATIDSVRSTSEGVEIQAGSSSALLLGAVRSDLQIRSDEVL